MAICDPEVIIHSIHHKVTVAMLLKVANFNVTLRLFCVKWEMKENETVTLKERNKGEKVKKKKTRA